MTLHSLRDRALLVAPIRLGLGMVWVAVARLVGASSAAALLAFAGGSFVTCFSLFNDPRSRFLPHRGAPQPAPADAAVARPLRQALAALLPSTLGVSVLAAIAVAFSPALTALLGGISAGLGIAGALSALRADPGLYVDPKSGIVYRR